MREWIHQLRAGGSGHDQSYASRTGSQSHSARQWSEILDQPRNTKVLDESRRYCPPKSSSGDHIERQTLAPVQFAMQHPRDIAPLQFLQPKCRNKHAGKYDNTYIIPVVPGQAGGGSFQKEKNYIAQKEFAYRMCAW